ncbi:MAG: adenylate kinase [Phycisphaerales bacterium]|nr:adenylate kinase [Phycisphaerales bacterium]
MNKINVVIFGPPGSGKGTQSEKIVECFQLKYLSTGDFLRSEIACKSSLGLRAQQYMDKGQLVPDSLVIDLIESFIDKNKESPGFLFDGFPRTCDQAVALSDMLKRLKQKISLVVALNVSEKELVGRIQKRGLISNRKDDQDVTIIKNRIKEYELKTRTVLDFYKNNFTRLLEINGEDSIDDIFLMIKKEITLLSAL